MLQGLSVQNVVLVDRLDLTFSAGLTVFTGETGAGKSILRDALNLALGARAEAALVRKDPNTAVPASANVTATFQLPLDHSVFTLLQERELEAESPLVLRRVVQPDGQSRAFINDQPVSIGLLKQVGQTLVDIHGQFDRLLDPHHHREALDQYGQHEVLLEAVQHAFKAWKTLKDTYAARLNAWQQHLLQQDYRAHLLEELAAFNPQPGEETTLQQKKQTLMHQEKLQEGLQAALGALSNSGSLSTAHKALGRIQDLAPEVLTPLVTQLDGILAEVEEVTNGLQRSLHDLNQDDKQLEEIDERLYQLRALARKHQCDAESLPQVLAALQQAHHEWEHQQEALEALNQEVVAAQQAYDQAAQDLTEARTHAAAALDAAVQQELGALKLEAATFMTRLLPLSEGGEYGRETVEFWVQTNRGAAPGPLARIASGGELSRFMLALKVVLAHVTAVPTLLFDEIDAGTGGAVADAIGQRLARLSQHMQVLTITHAPQVAALGDLHIRIHKEQQGDRTLTQAAPLSAAERQEEIARMLAGAQITEEARSAASRLLAAS